MLSLLWFAYVLNLEMPKGGPKLAPGLSSLALLVGDVEAPTQRG